MTDVNELTESLILQLEVTHRVLRDVDQFDESALIRATIDQLRALSQRLTESERIAADRNRVIGELGQRVAELEAALEIVRPHVDLMQAHLNGSYCAAKIDEHTFCGRGRDWLGHRSDAKEWPEHEFIDGGALVAALRGAGSRS
jgi:hypothetical protein